MSIVKTVTRRDSATAILRKIGIKPRDYSLFIETTADDTFAVKVGAATAHLESLAQPSDKTVVKELQVKELRAQLEEKIEKKAIKAKRIQAYRNKLTVQCPVELVPTEGQSCSSYSAAIILAGHTNTEVWAALVEHFKLDDKKRGYPAWYRHHLRKAGHKV
jgi:hypothetical protein